MTIAPGTQVRLKHDPATIGTTTPRTRLQGDVLFQQVQFSRGFEYVPSDQLELAGAVLDPVDLLEQGTLSPARDLRRVLTHARLSGRLADVLYSLDTTRTDFYAHQFKPVLKLLNNLSNGLLIADEVGLGKTIEAGLIWTELRTRFDYRRLVVLCPSVLRKKWRRELNERFGIRSEICDADQVLERLQQAERDPGAEAFAIVASIQGLRPRGELPEPGTKPKSPSRRLEAFLAGREGEEPLIDLLVIDEAHHLRNPETSNAELGRVLRANAGHAVLLTATPVNLADDDLFQLMRLIDGDTFQSIVEFRDILTANVPLVQARDAVLRGGLTPADFQESLEIARQHPVLWGSEMLKWMCENPPTAEQLASAPARAELAHRLDQVNLLGQVINRTRKRDVQTDRIVRKANAEAVPLTDQEREFYQRVTEVVREFCQQRGASEGFLLSMPQRQMASCMAAAYRYWKSLGKTAASQSEPEVEDGDDWDLIADSDGPEEWGSLTSYLMARVGGLASFEQLSAEDSKYLRLVSVLKELLAEEVSAKVIVFSSFRATLRYLGERLIRDGFHVLEMTGDTEDKDEVIRLFQEAERPTVLLSSEVGSEGVDLQFARVIINYDLPWNPMRVEQRIGRVDRLGQRAKSILIWNIFCAGTIDDRIYQRLYKRIGIFERSLGGLEPILGSELQRLTSQLLTQDLTPEQEAEKIDAAALAIENKRKIEEDLEDNASQLFALGDYLLNQVQAARELGRRISDDDIKNYVFEFIRAHFPDTKVEQEEPPSVVRMRLGTSAKLALEKFVARNRLAGQTRLHAATGDSIKCRFENVVGTTRENGVEVVSQFHPFVRFARDVIRDEGVDLRLAVAAQVSSASLEGAYGEGVYAFVVERWTVEGVQDSERLAYSACRLGFENSMAADESERLVNIASAAGREWSSALADCNASEVAKREVMTCLDDLTHRYEGHERTVRLQNNDRAAVLLTTLTRQVSGQVGRLRELETRFQIAGRTGLAAATQGRIEKLEERADLRRARITERSAVRTTRTLVLAGILKVSREGGS